MPQGLRNLRASGRYGSAARGEGPGLETQISLEEKRALQKKGPRRGRGRGHTPHLLFLPGFQNRLPHECSPGELCMATGCPRELPEPRARPVCSC